MRTTCIKRHWNTRESPAYCGRFDLDERYTGLILHTLYLGTSWPLNRQRTTYLLGFDSLVENSKLGREAWYAAETISALSFIMADLNDLATDLHIWSSVEFATVESHDGYCGTSSIFPQKKNPSGLETIEHYVKAGVSYVILGTKAVKNPEFVADACRAGDVELAVKLLDEHIAGVCKTLFEHLPQSH